MSLVFLKCIFLIYCYWEKGLGFYVGLYSKKKIDLNNVIMFIIILFKIVKINWVGKVKWVIELMYCCLLCVMIEGKVKLLFGYIILKVY